VQTNPNGEQFLFKPAYSSTMSKSKLFRYILYNLLKINTLYNIPSILQLVDGSGLPNLLLLLHKTDFFPPPVGSPDQIFKGIVTGTCWTGSRIWEQRQHDLP
jgi:hypothetical protein